MKKNNFKPSKFNINWIYGIVGLILVLILMFSDNFVGALGVTKNIDRTTFLSYVKQGYIKQADLEIDTKKVYAYLTDDALKMKEFKDFKKIDNDFVKSSIPNFTFNIADAGNFEKDFYYNVENSPNKTAKLNTIVPTGLSNVLFNIFVTFVIIGIIYFFVFRKIGGGAPSGGAGGIFSVGKSKAKMFDGKDNIKIRFTDIAGLDEAKEEVFEIVDFLKNPTKYTSLGGKIPKGALLVGPPGTGKTLLAKAVAGEAQVPFFSLSGSDFVEMFVGVGASRVRDLFKNAKEKSPSIIFIDEIDAIGRARGKSNYTGANDERENTLNQLLTEMDGFGTESNVIVIGATNRVDILDKALMRPGRFDRTIYIDLPELNERKKIFEVHIKPLVIDDSVDVDFLARQTPGFSGADIYNICNEAAIIAARKNKKIINSQDFLDSVDRVIAGLEKKSKIIKPIEKKRIAYHEAGHAIVGWLLEHAAPLVKVTIVPRGRSLGAAWYLPEERQIVTKEQMLDEICMTMGGRAAEQLILGNISTGALSDLEKVTKQVISMVTLYGLSPKLGNISYYNYSSDYDYGFSKPYSEKTAEIIDLEVKDIIDVQYNRAKNILSNNIDSLHQVAKKLLDKEVIFKEDLEVIFGPRNF